MLVTHPLITDSSITYMYVHTLKQEKGRSRLAMLIVYGSSLEEQGNQVIPYNISWNELGRERSSSSFETGRLENYYEALMTMTNYFNPT